MNGRNCLPDQAEFLPSVCMACRITDTSQATIIVSW
jgi:hypothetical protein